MLRPLTPAFALGIVVAAFLGCGAAATSPGGVPPLTMTASADRTTLAAGESATVTFRVTNTDTKPVTIDLPDSCLVQPHVVDAGSGRDVEGTGLVCAAVLTSVTLAPKESKDVTYPVRAGDATAVAPTLRPGTYRVHARLNDRVYRVSSSPVTITVKP